MSGLPPEIVVSGSENHTLRLTGIEAALLVSAAVSRLGDPLSGRYAIIGGLAILCRCRTAKRVTSDIDTVSAGMDRGALVADKAMASGSDPEEDVKFDRIVTEPLTMADLEGLPEKQQLFLAAHRWALESAGPVSVEISYRDTSAGPLEVARASLAVATAPALLAMKLHSIQDRRRERPEKEGSDAEDIYRIISEYDQGGDLARALSLAPLGLPQLVLSTAQKVLVDGQLALRRALNVYGGESAREIDSDDFSFVVHQFVNGLEQALYP